jgi:cytochrome c oxidase subunit 2
VRRRTAKAGLLAVVLAVAGCGDDAPRWGAPDPASEEGEQIRDLWQGFVLAGAAVALLVYGLLVFVLVRYRRRNDDVPRQNPYNVPIEILYTVAPIVIVAGLFAVSWATEEDVTSIDDDPAVVVEVVGFQWQWRFTYPDDDITLVGSREDGPPELVLPVDETVRFDLVAEDVAHSFWVPDFFEKRDLIPGLRNELDITPTRTGTFVGRCAEFCGLDHWRMGFTVRVVEPAEFDAWVEEHAGA